MNKTWSALNKTMQAQIKGKDTFEAGLNTLFDLRKQLMEVLTALRAELSRKDFNAIPFKNAAATTAKRLPIPFGIFSV